MNLYSNFLRFLIRRIPYIGPGTQGCRYYVPSVPKHLPNIIEDPLKGYPLRIRYNPHQFIGWCIYYRGIFEPELIAFVSNQLRSGMTFLDIGANIGLYSIVSALKVGESGKVYAFEPQPNLANIIHQNVTLNNFNNIIVHNCALADKNGTLELYFPNPENDGEATLGSLTSSSVPNINVDVNTLDELYAKSQSFLKTDYVIKIDVEGAEYSVLQGSRELFEIKKPEIILCECYDKFLKRFGHSDEDLFNLLKNYGYEIFALVGRFSPKFIQCDNYLQYKEQANCSSEILAILPETKSYEKLNKRCIKL